MSAFLLLQCVLTDTLAPLCLLYLLYPHSPTATAAHHALCAVVTALPASALEQLAPACISRWLQDEGQPVAWSQVDRFRVQHLAQGLSTIVKSLPGPSPVALRCIQMVIDKCVALAEAGHASGAATFFSAAAQQLFLVHYASVVEVMRMLEGCLLVCPAAAKPRLCAALFAVIGESEDCVRKPALARWYQRVAGRVSKDEKVGLWPVGP